MTLVPFTDCCLSLGVDPKTLRLWIKAAQLSCCLHPADARLKCLTLAQLEQLAQLHGRPLPSALPSPPPLAVAVPSDAAIVPNPTAPHPKPEETDLREQVNRLVQQVSTLQAQVAELALVLLRSSVTPAPAPAQPPAPTRPPQARLTAEPASRKQAVAPVPRPARQRSRALPLIEVRPDGSVVMIAPTEGVLPLLPDSAAWFTWLASIEAFSFESPQGRFSATRKFRGGQRIQSWNVHRSLHGRSCTLYLGLTPTLTLARLSEMAVAVHARLTSL